MTMIPNNLLKPFLRYEQFKKLQKIGLVLPWAKGPKQNKSGI
jgi:hypothetical protein